MKNYNIVYKATNKVNGKSYVGLSKNSIESRKYEHFKSAKYGSQQHFQGIGRTGKKCEVLGKQYKNGKAAADALNISSSTIRSWIKKKKNGAKYL